MRCQGVSVAAAPPSTPHPGGQVAAGSQLLYDLLGRKAAPVQVQQAGRHPRAVAVGEAQGEVGGVGGHQPAHRVDGAGGGVRLLHSQTGAGQPGEGEAAQLWLTAESGSGAATALGPALLARGGWQPQSPWPSSGASRVLAVGPAPHLEVDTAGKSVLVHLQGRQGEAAAVVAVAQVLRAAVAKLEHARLSPNWHMQG